MPEVCSVDGEEGLMVDRQAWMTPRHLFSGLHAEFGFGIDACADEHNAMVSRHWTESEDALTQDWSGLRVWCNPPYAEIGPWVDKAITAGMCALLVPTRTSRPWFRRALRHASLWLFDARVQYEPPPGVVASSCGFDSVLLVFGAGPTRYVGTRSAIDGSVIEIYTRQPAQGVLL